MLAVTVTSAFSFELGAGPLGINSILWETNPFLKLLLASLLLVAMPFAPSSVLVPSSKARSP